MKRTKQKFDVAFKRQVVEEALEADSKRSEVAHQYGLKPRLLYRWIAEYQKGISWAKGAEQKRSDAGYKAICKENRRLKMEVEFLKKASCYFASHHK